MEMANLTEQPSECSNCGSTEILSDYFEEEWMYWCSQCGHEIEVIYDSQKVYEEDAIPRTEREHSPDSVSSVGRD